LHMYRLRDYVAICITILIALSLISGLSAYGMAPPTPPAPPIPSAIPIPPKLNVTLLVKADGSVIPIIEFSMTIPLPTGTAKKEVMKLVSYYTKEQEEILNFSMNIPKEALKEEVPPVIVNASFTYEEPHGEGYVHVVNQEPSSKLPLSTADIYIDLNYDRSKDFTSLNVSFTIDLSEEYLTPENLSKAAATVNMMVFTLPMINQSIYNASEGNLWIKGLSMNFNPDTAVISGYIILEGYFSRALPYLVTNLPALMTTFPGVPSTQVPSTTPQPTISEDEIKLIEELYGKKFSYVEKAKFKLYASLAEGVVKGHAYAKYGGDLKKQFNESIKTIVDYFKQKYVKEVKEVPKALDMIKEFEFDPLTMSMNLTVTTGGFEYVFVGPAITYTKDPEKTYDILKSIIAELVKEKPIEIPEGIEIRVIGESKSNVEVVVEYSEQVKEMVKEIPRGVVIKDVSALPLTSAKVVKNPYGVANYVVEGSRGEGYLVATNSSVKDVKFSTEGVVTVKLSEVSENNAMNITVFKDKLGFTPIRADVVFNGVTKKSVEPTEGVDSYSVLVTYGKDVSSIEVRWVGVSELKLSVEDKEFTAPATIELSIECKDQFGNPIPELPLSILVNGEEVGKTVSDVDGIAKYELKIDEAGTYKIVAKYHEVGSNEVTIEVKAPPPVPYSVIAIIAVIVVIAIVAILIKRRS